MLNTKIERKKTNTKENKKKKAWANLGMAHLLVILI
jgi:hypothetical protein